MKGLITGLNLHSTKRVGISQYKHVASKTEGMHCQVHICPNQCSIFTSLFD